MSETTPDPVDVHTGTDRVELTEDERARIAKTVEVSGALTPVEADWITDHLLPDVESIVAARVQAKDQRIAELEAELARCRS